MARMTGSSVSTNVCALDERWIRCYVHILNNAMKAAMGQCNNHAVLKNVSEDFRAVKRVVEDANWAQWGKKLPDGYRLVQEIETRFGTNYLVEQRFLKLSLMALGFIASDHRDSALQAFKSILQEQSSTPCTNR